MIEKINIPRRLLGPFLVFAVCWVIVVVVANKWWKSKNVLVTRNKMIVKYLGPKDDAVSWSFFLRSSGSGGHGNLIVMEPKTLLVKKMIKRSPSSYHSTRSGEWMISLGDRLVWFFESLGRRSSSMYVVCISLFATI
jgi:hypothetical protein